MKKFEMFLSRINHGKKITRRRIGRRRRRRDARMKKGKVERKVECDSIKTKKRWLESNVKGTIKGLYVTQSR